MQNLDTEYLSKLTKANVLALDIASHCGYRYVKGGGTWYFPNNDKAPKKLGEDYGQHKVFRQKIIDFISEHDIKVIAAEDVIYSHFVDFRKLCMFRGILSEVCESLGIPVIYFKPSDIKKWATGNGNADKKMMIEYCKKRWHIDPVDDNEADATHIWFYFIRRYKL